MTTSTVPWYKLHISEDHKDMQKYQQKQNSGRSRGCSVKRMQSRSIANGGRLGSHEVATPQLWEVKREPVQPDHQEEETLLGWCMEKRDGNASAPSDFKV